jgi:alginate O-acetyltransferase complex protein AlgI
MLFNTLVFAKFFGFVFVATWLLAGAPRARFWLLAVASYVFYAGLDLFTVELPRRIVEVGFVEAMRQGAPHLQFVPIVFLGSTIDYALARWIDRTEEPRARKLALVVTITMNASLLLVFKYWDFLAEQVIALGGPDKRLHLPLPIGISFFTFMSLSYVIDVYRREIYACRDYAQYITYIAFFPHLVAGPIIRGKDLLPLFERPAVLGAMAAGEGLFLVCVGLAKKVVVGDYLALNLVNRVVDEPTSFSSVEVFAAMFGYLIQIYCDFSGYSDVAIGVALLLGYRLRLNFDAPLKASNIVEFWRRWHISLSSWLRDYVYIPLGGGRVARAPEPPERERTRNRVASIVGAIGVTGCVWVTVTEARSPSPGAMGLTWFLAAAGLAVVGLSYAKSGRKYLHVWLTMVLCGIWHGAAWSYVLFGVVQGLGVGFTHLWFDARGKRPGDAGDGGVSLANALGVLGTLLFATVSFVLIRAPVDKALLLYRQLLVGSTFTPNLSAPLIVAMALPVLTQCLPRRAFETVRDAFCRAPAPAQALALFVVAVVLRAAASAEAVPFVYGQF